MIVGLPIIDLGFLTTEQIAAIEVAVTVDPTRRVFGFGEDAPFYVTPDGVSYILTKSEADGLYEPLLSLAANEFRARSSAGPAANFDISDFSLSLMGEVDQSAWQTALGVSGTAGYTVSNDPTFAGASPTALTTEYAVRTAIDSAVAGVLQLGSGAAYDASSNLFPTTGGTGPGGAIAQGDVFYIAVGGTLGSKVVAAGDVIFALADTPGQTDASWGKLETNIGYAPLDRSLNLSDLANAPTALINLGGTTVGINFFKLSNPGASAFPRINADNSVTARSAANFRTDLGVGTADDVTFNSLTVSAGSVGSTSLRLPTAGSGTGIYSTGNDTIAFSNAGALSSMFDSSGRQIVGHTAAVQIAGSTAARYQQYGTSAAAGMTLGRWQAGSGGCFIRAAKSRNASIGSATAVLAGDTILAVGAYGDDGTDWDTSAVEFLFGVDSNASNNIVPGRLTLSMMDTAGVSNVVQRINSEGRMAVRQNVSATAWIDIGAGVTGGAQIRLRSGVAPSAPNSGDIWYDGTDVVVQESIKSTATTAATSATTGSGIFGGGIGVAGNAWIAGKTAMATTDALVTAHSTMGATETFDASVSDVHTGTLDQACTFTLSNPSASGRQTTLILDILQNGTGGFAITWPASVKADPASPTVITTANTLTRYVLTTYDAGTTWYRSIVFTGVT